MEHIDMENPLKKAFGVYKYTALNGKSKFSIIPFANHDGSIKTFCEMDRAITEDVCGKCGKDVATVTELKRNWAMAYSETGILDPKMDPDSAFKIEDLMQPSTLRGYVVSPFIVAVP